MVPTTSLDQTETGLGGYREIIEYALHEHSSLTTRQENDPNRDISELFTDNKQVRTLEKPDWQIVFGRRGTGKTTLLNKLADVIDAKEGYASLTIQRSQMHH